jgi:hypothetical protein
MSFTTGFEDATINGQTARVLRFSRPQRIGGGSGDTLRVRHGLSPNGTPTASRVNRYSIIMDVLFTDVTYSNNTGRWISLVSTDNPDTTNDGDWFIRGDNGMGISGNYTDAYNPVRFVRGQWMRIALVIDATTPVSPTAPIEKFMTVYRSYVNGKLQNVVQRPSGWGIDGRFTLSPASSDTPWFLLFGDEDNETNEGFINNLQVRDYAMSDMEIAQLGGPTAGPIDTTILPTANVSGTVTLDGLTMGQERLFLFEVTPQGGNPSLTPMTLDPLAANYTLSGVVRAVNNVRIKTLAYLTTAKSADTTGGDVTGLSHVLRPGDLFPANSADIFADDIIDLFDLITFFEAYGAQPGDSNWNANADMTTDDIVDLFDLILFFTYYGQSGD